MPLTWLGSNISTSEYEIHSSENSKIGLWLIESIVKLQTGLNLVGFIW